MDWIDNYVENLFTGLPKTSQVLQLKADIANNLEEKFSALLTDGKTPNEAMGIVVSEFGSMEELCREMGIAAEPEPEVRTTPTLEEEYRSFRKNFGLAIGFGVLLCILGIIMMIVLSQLLGNSILSLVSLLLPVAVAVFIFIYFGIQNEQFQETRNKESSACKNPEKEEQKCRDNMADNISGIIMMIAVIVFLMLGFLKNLWHPGWVILPICGLLCGVVSNILNMKRK